jgi:hypothetical protein
MARKHALFISVAVACALVAGVFAAVRTTELGASASTGNTLSDRELTTRDRQLDRLARRIDEHARKRPPKLPALRMPSRSGSGSSAVLSSNSGPGPSGPSQALISNSGPGSSTSGHDDFDHDEFDDDDSSGHGRGGDDDDHDGDSSGYGGHDDDGDDD